MQDTALPRRVLFASAALLVAMALAVPAAANPLTPCGVISAYRDKKLVEGSPVTATGKLEIKKRSSGFVASLVNDEGVCAVALEGDAAQMKPVAACGHSAKATVGGIITEELFVATIIPSMVTCH